MDVRSQKFFEGHFRKKSDILGQSKNQNMTYLNCYLLKVALNMREKDSTFVKSRLNLLKEELREVKAHWKRHNDAQMQPKKKPEGDFLEKINRINAKLRITEEECEPLMF